VNAHFFATDGIAGFGLGGIPMIGILCALVFWVLDSCSRNYSLGFSVSALTLTTFSLTNVSLFTTLLGNGLVAWILLFIIMPRSFLSGEMQASPPEARIEKSALPVRH
jgi:hypothetical protein